jgi:hypothetical protein
MPRNFFSFFLVIGIVSLCLLGCGGATAVPHDQLFAAKGTVTIDGNPLAGATVILSSELTQSKGWTTSGVTAEDGTVQFRTQFGPTQIERGVLAGDYKAVVTKANAGAFVATTSTAPAASTPNAHSDFARKQIDEISKRKAAKPKSADGAGGVPAIYSNPSTTPLKVDVRESELSFSLELKSN